MTLRNLMMLIQMNPTAFLLTMLVTITGVVQAVPADSTVQKACTACVKPPVVCSNGWHLVKSGTCVKCCQN